MKIYIVYFEDFTISGQTGILGVYDSKDLAEKRAKDFAEYYIKSDSKGPLGETWVMEHELNKSIIGCAEEAFRMRG